MTIAMLLTCAVTCVAALMATHQGWISWRFGGVLVLVACVSTGGLLLVRTLVRRRRQAREGTWSLLPTMEPDSAAANDDEALAEQLDRAMRRLRASRSARRRLDALPWYLVIGGPSAGKTSALAQSRAIRLGDEDAAAHERSDKPGIAIWIGRDALFLECPGVYLVDPAGDERWKALIAQLVRMRPSSPLDGVVLAVSLDELLAEDASRELLADCVRRRLDTLMTALDAPLPVHLLVTKADLQAGFRESFEGASESEREQVFGFTLPRGTSCADGHALSAHAQRLVQVIERRTIATLGALPSVAERCAAFDYPERVALLMSHIDQFVRRALGAAIHLEPLLRGVYLTSAAQDRVPRDPATPGVDRGSHAGPALQRAYFLGGLLGKLISGERGAASAPRSLRRARSLRIGAAVVAIACATSSVGMVRAYHHNGGLLRAAGRELETALALPLDATRGDALRTLEPIRARVELLSRWETESLPISRRFGLYQGDAVIASLRRFYVDALRARALLALGEGLERALLHGSSGGVQHQVSPSTAAYVKLYEQTRAYALLTFPKERGEPGLDAMRASGLRQVLLSEADALSLTGAERTLLGRHLDTYFAMLALDARVGLSRGSSVLAAARGALREVSLPKLTIDRVVARLSEARLEQTVASLLGTNDTPIVSRSQVPGAFTRQAWEQHVKPLLDDPRGSQFEGWVLGAESAETPPCALREAYFARYAEAWRGFLAGLRVRQPSDPRDALIVLQDLTRGQPAPIERLVRAVGHQVDLAPPPDKAAPARASEPGLFEELRDRLRAGGEEKGMTCSSAGREDAVRRALAGFLAFGGAADSAPEGGQVAGAQVFQEQLVYVRDALQAYLDDPTTAEALLGRLSTARTRVRSLIETQEIGWRPRFEALLWPAIDGASTRALAALRGAQSAAFCTAVTLPFERALYGRYPFDRDGQDASLADLADVYRPNDGIIWGYYQSALKRDVPAVGGRFAERARARYAPELARFLEHAARLTAVLFPPRAAEPQAGLELRVRPAIGVARVSLVIDGQSIDVHNGPERWHAITWPGASARRGASMRVSGQGVDEHIVQEGEWGLFRLLERGTVSSEPGARFFTVRFRLRTQHDVVIDVRPLRVDNPFFGPRGFLDAFRAEGVMAPRSIVRGEKSRCANGATSRER